MSFDTKAFMNEKFELERKKIPITNPRLKSFFTNGKNVWEIRALTGRETARTKAASDKYKNIDAIYRAIESQVKSEKKKGWEDLVSLGIGSETTADFAKRIETLLIGSVSPELENKEKKVSDVEFVIKFSDFFTLEFYTLTNEIYNLTGMGGLPGKQKASGKTAVSERV